MLIQQGSPIGRPIAPNPWKPTPLTRSMKHQWKQTETLVAVSSTQAFHHMTLNSGNATKSAVSGTVINMDQIWL